MDTQFLIDTISRITHVSTAIALAGGTVFVLFVLIPATAAMPESDERSLRVAVNQRWKRFVHIGIALFLVSGFYNFIRAIPLHKGDGLYHALIGTKILLAFAMFFIASALVGRSKAFDSMRKNRVVWLKVIVLLAIYVVANSGVAKVRGGPRKTVIAEPTSALK